MTTNVSIVLIWVADSWPDQTRLPRLIHTKFITLLSWYRARCSVTWNSGTLCIHYSDKKYLYRNCRGFSKIFFIANNPLNLLLCLNRRDICSTARAEPSVELSIQTSELQIKLVSDRALLGWWFTNSRGCHVSSTSSSSSSCSEVRISDSSH